MNLKATNMMTRGFYRFMGTCLFVGLTLAFSQLAKDVTLSGFVDNVAGHLLALAFILPVLALNARYILKTPIVDFTDTHVVVTRGHHTQNIAWGDIQGSSVFGYSGMGPFDPVRLHIKGTLFGLSFYGTDEAKAYLKRKFAK